MPTVLEYLYFPIIKKHVKVITFYCELYRDEYYVYSFIPQISIQLDIKSW